MMSGEVDYNTAEHYSIYCLYIVKFSLKILPLHVQEDRENILRARATGKAVLTSPFSLLGSHHLGVVLTFPVYKSKLPQKPTVEERIEATAGWVLVSLLFVFQVFFCDILGDSLC